MIVLYGAVQVKPEHGRGKIAFRTADYCFVKIILTDQNHQLRFRQWVNLRYLCSAIL
jgi:hypothetical protein